VLLLDLSTLQRPVLTCTCLYYRPEPELHLDLSEQGACADMDVSTSQGAELHLWTCLHYRGLCCTWTCPRYKGLSCTWTCLVNRSLCFLLNVSTLQGSKLLLDLSTLQWPVLHLDVSRLNELIVLLNVSILQRPVVPVQQEPALLLDVNFAFLKSRMLPLECWRHIFFTKIYLKKLFCRQRLRIILSYYLLRSQKHSIVDLDDDSLMLIMKHLIFMKH
jgi:hypothetical protein